MSTGPANKAPAWQDLLKILSQKQETLLASGYTELDSPLPGIEKLDHWLAQGMHAGMDYMPRTAEVRKDPQSHFPGMRSAWVGLWKYPQALQPFLPDSREPFVAAYAQGPDYHHTIGQILYGWAASLAELPQSVVARPFVDALPVSERTLATKAGLGFIGRSGMLIHPRHGTGFFIAGLLLSEKAPVVAAQPLPFAHGCTTCRECLEACPTQAIDANGLVDARLCVSYLTIEHRGDFTQEQSVNAGHALFGCDICQSVCPYNKRHIANHNSDTPSYWPTTHSQWQALSPEGAGLSRRIRNTPLARTGRKGLLRNLAAWIDQHPGSDKKMG